MKALTIVSLAGILLLGSVTAVPMMTGRSLLSDYFASSQKTPQLNDDASSDMMFSFDVEPEEDDHATASSEEVTSRLAAFNSVRAPSAIRQMKSRSHSFVNFRGVGSIDDDVNEKLMQDTLIKRFKEHRRSIKELCGPQVFHDYPGYDPINHFLESREIHINVDDLMSLYRPECLTSILQMAPPNQVQSLWLHIKDTGVPIDVDTVQKLFHTYGDIVFSFPIKSWATKLEQITNMLYGVKRHLPWFAVESPFADVELVDALHLDTAIDLYTFFTNFVWTLPYHRFAKFGEFPIGDRYFAHYLPAPQVYLPVTFSKHLSAVGLRKLHYQERNGDLLEFYVGTLADKPMNINLASRNSIEISFGQNAWKYRKEQVAHYISAITDSLKRKMIVEFSIPA